MPSEHYTKSFYEQMRNGATRSAEVIVPLVLQLVPVRSVLDVGCGDGSWLSVFRKLGVEDILGIDGDYVDQDFLQIPKDHFQAFDLTKPFSLGRIFDLVISLEVAEHLPSDCAGAFVESLTRIAPLVLFSAAIPFQGGNHHLNEQWQDKWADLFQTHGYLPVDFIRKRIWQNDSVDWWYAQNTLLFAQVSLIDNNASLKAEFENTAPPLLRLVHPKQYLYLQDRYREEAARPQAPLGIKATSRHLMAGLKNSFRKRLNEVLRKEKLPIKIEAPAKSSMKK